VAPSVEARLKGLRDLLAEAGAKMEELGTLESRTFWREVRDVAPLAGGRDAVVWKISCPPTEGPGIVARIRAQRPSAEAFYDWSGGLVWLALPPTADADHAIVRGAIGATGGHATLIRANEKARAGVPVFHPQPSALAALASRVKESFDPRRLFNPGRMG
jgi:glycolate oxidase FAD binding subunit